MADRLTTVPKRRLGERMGRLNDEGILAREMDDERLLDEPVPTRFDDSE